MALPHIETALAGASPQSRYRDKVAIVCDWLLRWQYAPTSILLQRLGVDSGRARAWFGRQDWLTPLDLVMGERTWMLTSKGKQFAAQFASAEYTGYYEHRKHRVCLAIVPHQIACQRAALALWDGQAPLVTHTRPWVPKPDFVIDRTAVEVELSSKQRHEFLAKLGRYGDAIEHGTHMAVRYVFRNRTLCEKYASWAEARIWPKYRRHRVTGCSVPDGEYEPSAMTRAVLSFEVMDI